MPFSVDIPQLPPMSDQVMCSIIAAVKYEIPANIVLAVAGQENGKPGQWNKNKNGTYDVGPLQFNTGYLVELNKYGITARDVEKGGCYSFDLAAWRIRGHILNDKGDLWTRVANYHSRTPSFNAIYRKLVMKRALVWADWLDARFATQTVAQNDVMSGETQFKPAAEITIKASLTPRDKPAAKQQPLTSSKPISLSDSGYTPRRLFVNGQ